MDLKNKKQVSGKVTEAMVAFFREDKEETNKRKNINRGDEGAKGLENKWLI